jgi:tRNA U34 2-thiouridine synthase MnmA/TrmU
MKIRTRDRLKALEAKIAPKGRHLVFVHFEEPEAALREEQLAAFKTEHRIAASDIIHEVSINFA